MHRCQDIDALYLPLGSYHVLITFLLAPLVDGRKGQFVKRYLDSHCLTSPGTDTVC